MQDAAAICEAASRPEMRFVSQKSIAQQDMQMLHRIRSRLVGKRKQLGNQIRGLLAEYGIIVPLHLHQLRRKLIELTSEPHPELTAFAQELFASLYAELRSVDEQIAAMEQRIQQAFQRDETCQKIADVEGVGQVIATAIVAAIADGKAFRIGRIFSLFCFDTGGDNRTFAVVRRSSRTIESPANGPISSTPS